MIAGNVLITLFWLVRNLLYILFYTKILDCRNHDIFVWGEMARTMLFFQ